MSTCLEKGVHWGKFLRVIKGTNRRNGKTSKREKSYD